ncbi:hypothetical protein [Jannaschia sp. LMIT008]|uniref:hypothetical protein n=1 Tax=Jannaschia maritima TaxID=3032585 RepID=UPI00281180B2|nr:hypothetical protein [Jannaschia sp. LMIT008]
MARTRDPDDVLKSIRRLVADHGSRNGPDAPERLILDADRRVVEPEDPFQTIDAVDDEEGSDEGEAPTPAFTSYRNAPEGEPAESPLVLDKPLSEPETQDGPEGTDIPGETDVAPSQQDVVPSSVPAALDEDALRRMVAEAVRAELTGSFGPRVLNNIRKLVRREVRANLAQDSLD